MVHWVLVEIVDQLTAGSQVSQLYIGNSHVYHTHSKIQQQQQSSDAVNDDHDMREIWIHFNNFAR